LTNGFPLYEQVLKQSGKTSLRTAITTSKRFTKQNTLYAKDEANTSGHFKRYKIYNLKKSMALAGPPPVHAHFTPVAALFVVYIVPKF